MHAMYYNHESFDFFDVTLMRIRLYIYIKGHAQDMHGYNINTLDLELIPELG